MNLFGLNFCFVSGKVQNLNRFVTRNKILKVLWLLVNFKKFPKISGERCSILEKNMSNYDLISVRNEHLISFEISILTCYLSALPHPYNFFYTLK